MGRHAKPISLHLVEGNPNRLTKAEIEERKKAEIKIPKGKIRPPEYLLQDPTAHKYWQQIIKDYKQGAKLGVDIITSADTNILAAYCKALSTYEDFIRIKEEFENDIGDDLTARNLTVLTKLENSINRKLDMLLKMEDRLFLNPLSRIRSVPKPKKPDPKNPMEDIFDI